MPFRLKRGLLGVLVVGAFLAVVAHLNSSRRVDPYDIDDMRSFARDFLSEHASRLAQLSSEFPRRPRDNAKWDRLCRRLSVAWTREEWGPFDSGREERNFPVRLLIASGGWTVVDSWFLFLLWVPEEHRDLYHELARSFGPWTGDGGYYEHLQGEWWMTIIK